MTALYLLGAVLVALVAAALLAPLFLHREADIELEDLPPERRREEALEALTELEFEHQTGKLPDDEYERLRSRYARIAEEAERASGGAPGTSEARGPCPGCGRAVPAGARYCPRCGRPRDGGEASAEAPAESRRAATPPEGTEAP